MSAHSDIVTMNETELKIALKEYITSGRNWDETKQSVILKSMLTHIGSTDSELRDELIYSSFCKLILENQIEPEVMSELVDRCLSNSFLFKGIGENGTDSVFTRSFTTLLIALILHKDNEDDFLSQSSIVKIKDQLIYYMNAENDLRGYVSEKGWAHSIGHVSDAFAQLVINKKIDRKFFVEILQTLWNKVFVHQSVYIHDEDERILIPIFLLLENGLKAEVVENLVQNIPYLLKGQKEQIKEEEYWFLVANCKSFLKSFSIRLNKKSNLGTIQEKIETCLLEI